MILASTLLFGGCTTRSGITREETVGDDKDAYFYLKDGTSIISFSGKHHREADGYHAIGTIKKKGMLAEPFSGLIADGDIERISIEEFSIVGTIAVTVIAVGGYVAYFRSWTLGSD